MLMLRGETAGCGPASRRVRREVGSEAEREREEEGGEDLCNVAL